MDTPTRFLSLEDGGAQPGWTPPLTGGWSEHLGWFSFYFGDGRWVWSPQVEQMHGYRPGRQFQPQNWCCPMFIPTI
ncbi:antar domain protein [Mycobacterium xenopi 4042]|uniref:Antar domain protein n=1 Tax=Mycobacterium xenopi 4042 TaxID=1299334 RepID=X8E718_MYCXE|nr:antar domain protein [Mycobacterium xenopi 4042]